MKRHDIKIFLATRQRLSALGSKGESYDTIINKLIDFKEKDGK